jgi:cytochrome c biogenesis protein CcdA
MITPDMGRALELAVGLMLVALGLRIVYRLWRDRIHIHVHSHPGQPPHLHIHSHSGDVADHKASYHLHSHAAASWRRSLGVGMMHGLAGSAAIVALTAAGTSNAILGLLFIAIFGIGSMLGMALFTSVISWPLTLTARHLTWANRSLQLVAGVVATLIGLNIIYAQASVITTLFG